MVDWLVATKAKSTEVMVVWKVVGVVTWAHWAVQVALGGTQMIQTAAAACDRWY
jgi:hypothetical protein